MHDLLVKQPLTQLASSSGLIKSRVAKTSALTASFYVNLTNIKLYIDSFFSHLPLCQVFPICAMALSAHSLRNRSRASK